MQLSETTLEILSNFKNIQQNMVFEPGSKIKTMSDSKSIMAEAEIDVEIPKEFGIYDLGEFLATLNLVDSPKLELNDRHAVLSSTSGRSRIKYFFSDPEMLTYPTKSVNMPSAEVMFTLTADTLSKIKKAASTLGHELMMIKSDDDVLVLSVIDPDNPTSNTFSIDVPGEFTGEFTFFVNLNNLKIMALDYEVSISKKLIAQFDSQDTNFKIKYWVPLDKKSEYS